MSTLERQFLPSQTAPRNASPLSPEPAASGMLSPQTLPPHSSVAKATVGQNSAKGGLGGVSGGGGYSVVYPPGEPGTVISNIWPAPPNGINGIAFGGIGSAGRLLNTLLDSNTPANGHGMLADLGHNLSSDGTCFFTNIGSINSTDASLEPLGSNGGPTLTMALLPGSPAIDAGDSSSTPPTDQRGVPRPYGRSADIGAFEYWLNAKAMACPTGGLDIMAFGIAGQKCCLQVSTNLTSWTMTATNEIGADGTAIFHEDEFGDLPHFYRLKLR